MTNRKVFFVAPVKMLANFRKIKESDLPMAKEERFYAFLAGFAGTETNVQHLILVLTLALKNVISGYPVNLSQHVEALVDDAETIKAVRVSLERIAILIKQKERPGQSIAL